MCPHFVMIVASLRSHPLFVASCNPQLGEEKFAHLMGVVLAWPSALFERAVRQARTRTGPSSGSRAHVQRQQVGVAVRSFESGSSELRAQAELPL